MRVITFFLLLITFKAFAQDDFTGNITTLSGEKLIGKIKTDKNLFLEVQFIGLDGKMTKYAPGEIKGFSIKYPQQRLPVYYESMQLDSIGNVFAQRRFSDGKIKYYYTEYKESKDKVGMNIYTVIDTIFHPHGNGFSNSINYNEWLNGGIILSNTDTLKGELYFPDPWGLSKHLKFRSNPMDKEVQSYRLNDLKGYFSKDFSYITLNTTESEEKAVFESWRGNPMQVVGEEVKGQRPNFGAGNKFGSTSYTYYKYYIKRSNSDEILQILERTPTLPKKYIEKINEWFKDYPALAEAIIAKQLTAEVPIAILYNIHYTINNTQ